MHAVARGSAVVELRADGALAGQLVGDLCLRLAGVKIFCMRESVSTVPLGTSLTCGIVHNNP